MRTTVNCTWPMSLKQWRGRGSWSVCHECIAWWLSTAHCLVLLFSPGNVFQSHRWVGIGGRGLCQLACNSSPCHPEHSERFGWLISRSSILCKDFILSIIQSCYAKKWQQYLEGSSPPSALCSDLNSMTECYPMAAVFSILTCHTTVHSSKSILLESLSTLFRGFDSGRRTSSAQYTPGQEVWLTQDLF